MPRRMQVPRLMTRGLFMAACACLLSCDLGETPITRALRYLHANQVRQEWPSERNGFCVVDYPGNWPQFFFFEDVPDIRIREVSPFVVSFIHHALTDVVEENAAALELNPEHIERARDMRRRAVTFLRRFEASHDGPDAGAFGFWPYDQYPESEQTWFADLMADVLQGPVLGGSRLPVNLDVYPRELAIPSDADVTATTYAVLLDDALLDGGPGASQAVEQLLAQWRDTGDIPRRLNPDWLPAASGAFLTWLNCQDTPGMPIPNDVDLVVNANVLYALARYERLDTPGVSEAISLINRVTQEGLHRTASDEITDYYPDNFAFHYCVSRAYHEGPVPDLQPAVEALADDVEQSVVQRWDGVVYWDRGEPHLNTAFAVLTLLNAGRCGALVDRAVDYLVSEQDPLCGNWEESVFFIGRTEGGLQVNWASSSLTTAIALEALCRHRLSATGTVPSERAFSQTRSETGLSPVLR